MARKSPADIRAELAETLKALAEPHRLQILAELDGRPLTIKSLTEFVGLKQSTVSHHVRILIKAGLVKSKKEGVRVWVRLVPGALDRVAEALAGVR